MKANVFVVGIVLALFNTAVMFPHLSLIRDKNKLNDFAPHPPHLKMVDSDPINTVQHSQKGQNLIQRWAGRGAKRTKR